MSLPEKVRHVDQGLSEVETLWWLLQGRRVELEVGETSVMARSEERDVIGVEDEPLVLLKIVVVSEREAPLQRDDRCQVAGPLQSAL